jgi:hypothetical protein
MQIDQEPAFQKEKLTYKGGPGKATARASSEAFHY